MNQPTRAQDPGSEIVLYATEDGRSRIEVRLENGTVWLTINQMAELFQVDKSGISRHLNKIYETGELQREATVAKYATVQKEGKRKAPPRSSISKICSLRPGCWRKAGRSRPRAGDQSPGRRASHYEDGRVAEE